MDTLTPRESFTSQQQQRGEDSPEKLRTYTPQDLIDRLWDESICFVDVREEAELIQGMIPGAIHQPRVSVIATLDPESNVYRPFCDWPTELIFYCRSGNRSAPVARCALEMGHDPVGHLEGGLQAWAAAGGPITV